MRSFAVPLVLLAVLVVTGCQTSTRLLLPPKTDILLKGERFQGNQDGYAEVTTTPYFWTGISYELVQGDKVVQQGKMPSRFRFVSLLWPPYAILYWPKGFSYNCYDLTKETAAQCPPATPEEKEKREKQAQMREAKRQANAAKRAAKAQQTVE